MPHQANTNRGENSPLGPRIAYVANEGAVAERAKLLVGSQEILWKFRSSVCLLLLLL